MTPETFLQLANLLPEPTLLVSGGGVVLTANLAARERLGMSPDAIRGRPLAEMVVEPPDEVTRYLRACCRHRKMVLGSLTISTVEPFACRAEGAVLRPAGEGEEALLLLRLVPKQSAAGKFVALNQRIDQLGREIHRRQRAERSLDEERDRLRITLASIGDAVIATDAEGRITFINAVAEGLTGWPLAEAVGRPLPDVFRIVNERTRAPAENPGLRALREGVIVGLANHTILIARDGTERPIDDSAAPIRDGTAAPVGAVLVFRDIAERRRAEDALRASEERFRTLFESMGEGFCVVEMLYDEGGRPNDFRFLQVNPTFEMHTGLANAVGRTMREMVPGHEAHWFEVYGRVAATGEPARFVHEARAMGRWYDVYAYRTGNPDRNQVAILFSDISERRRGEEDLARVTAESGQRKRLYETILSATPDFVYVFSLDHRVLYANDALLAMWGRGTEGAIGKTFLEIGYEPWHAEMHDREIDQVRATRRPLRGEVPFNGTHGRRIYDYIFAPVLGADGEVEAVAGVTRDVTERKEMEDALREADQKKDDFIALLAHELRNPLAPIRNGLQVLRLASGDANAAVGQARSMMDRQLTHMVRLIDDLLDVSRISRNKMELRCERVPLADVVNTAVETARPLIDAEGHELNISLPQRPVYLDADLTRLAQVFSNLLANSAKYTPPGGRIWLTAERRGGEVAVSVRDTGIGIPGGSLLKIFDMFSQVDRTIERATGGLGIGLALVKGLVEMHGGTVTAASEGEGRGSTFTVALPTLEARPGPAITTTADNGRPASGRRILVVDDNRDGADSLAMMLRLMNNEVRTANDGIEAVAAAEQFRPEVILMDVGMPKLNGLAATRRIREHPWGKDMTVIALTGWGQEGDKALSREAGCDGHLVKPVDLAVLDKLLQGLSRTTDPDG